MQSLKRVWLTMTLTTGEGLPNLQGFSAPQPLTSLTLFEMGTTSPRLASRNARNIGSVASYTIVSILLQSKHWISCAPNFAFVPASDGR